MVSDTANNPPVERSTSSMNGRRRFLSEKPAAGSTSSGRVEGDASIAHPGKSSTPRMHGGMHYPPEAAQEEIEEFPYPPGTPGTLSRQSRSRMDDSWVVPDMSVPNHYPVVCITSQGQADQSVEDDEELVDVLMNLAEEGCSHSTPSQPSSSGPCTSTPLTSAAPPFLPPAPSTPARVKRCSVTHEGKRCWRVATQQCSSYKCK